MTVQTAMPAHFVMNEEDEIVSMLARSMYVHFSEHRHKVPQNPPFATEWAYDYARVALKYLAYDDATIDQLRTDYK